MKLLNPPFWVSRKRNRNKQSGEKPSSIQDDIKIIKTIGKLCNSITEEGEPIISVDISSGLVQFSDSAFRVFLADIKGNPQNTCINSILNGIRLYCGFMRSYTNGLQTGIDRGSIFRNVHLKRLRFVIMGKDRNPRYTGWQTEDNLFMRECMKNEALEALSIRADEAQIIIEH